MKQFVPKKVKEKEPSQFIPDRFAGKTLDDVTPFDPVEDLKKAGEAVGHIGQALDIPASFVRTGVEAGLNPEKEVLPALTGRFEQFRDNPTMDFGSTAPSGKDILKQTPIPANTYTGIAAELLTDPSTYTGGVGVMTKASKELARKLSRSSIKNTSKMLARYLTRTNMKKGIDPEVLAHEVMLNDFNSLVTDPIKMIEKIGGEAVIEAVRDPRTKLTTFKKVKEGSGLVGQIGKELDNHVAKYNSAIEKMGAFAQKGELLDAYVARMMHRLEKTAYPRSTEDLQKRLKVVSDAIGGDLDKSFSLQDLHVLKKRVGERLRDNDFYGDAKTPEVTQELMDFRDYLTDTIVETLDFVDEGASAAYKINNRRYHNFLNLSKAMQNKTLEEMKSPSFIDDLAGIMTMGGLGAAAGSIGGYQVEGALLGGMYSFLRGAGQQATERMPRYMAKGSKVLSQPFRAIGYSKLMRASEMAVPLINVQTRGDYVTRDPQSIDESDILSARLPRSTTAILEKPHVFLEKLRLTDPNSATDFAFILDAGDERQMQDWLMMYSRQNPMHFEHDRYGSWDGKIDPQLKDKAVKDIMNNPSESYFDRIMKRHNLNRTGEL